MLNFEICTKSGGHKKKTRPAGASPDILGVFDTHRVKQWKALSFPAVAQITDPSSQKQSWAQGTRSSHDSVTWKQWKLSRAVLSRSVMSDSLRPQGL